MKLFRDKNRGPKTRREDVIIPEEYLEYERQAKAHRQVEATPLQTEAVVSQEAEEALIDASNTENISDELTDETAVLDGPIVDAEGLPPIEKDSKKSRLSDKLIHIKKKKEKPIERKPKRVKKFDMRLVGLMSGITLAVTLLVCLLGPLMAIDRVEINGTKNLKKEQVIQLAEYPQTRNLFLYRKSKAEKELQLQPYVKEVKIRRHFPHWISIDIVERTPAGILLDNGHYIQFSKDGILLDNTKALLNPALPIITGFSMKDIPAPGEHFRDNDRFKDALEIVNACSDDLLPMIQEINIKDRQNILAYTNQGIEIRLGSIKHIKKRMHVLEDIMNQVILSDTVEKPIEALDIRYEKSPVIVLKGYHNAAEENKQKYLNEERAKMDAEKEKAEKDDKTKASSQKEDKATEKDNKTNNDVNGSAEQTSAKTPSTT